jgi:3-dehydroquinate dehydratase
MDANKKKTLTAAEMQHGFSKVRGGACCNSRNAAKLLQVGASMSLQQLNVLCSAPFGRSNEFAYAELKSNVAASLASTVTNVHAAMTIVLRVIKNRDMSTHTLFNMMDASKKVLLPVLLRTLPHAA